MLDHLIDPIKTPADALSNALILAITAPNGEHLQRAMVEVQDIAASVPDETIAQIKLSIEEFWMDTDTADNAGE